MLPAPLALDAQLRSDLWLDGEGRAKRGLELRARPDAGLDERTGELDAPEEELLGAS